MQNRNFCVCLSTSFSQTAVFFFQNYDRCIKFWLAVIFYWSDIRFKDVKNDNFCNMITRHACQSSASILSISTIWIHSNKNNVSVGHAFNLHICINSLLKFHIMIKILSSTDRWISNLFLIKYTISSTVFFATLKNSKLKLTP